MKVITIGNATLDIALKSPEFKINENSESLCFYPGNKFYINETHFNLGGGAINSSFTFAKLGFKTDVYFKIGKDRIKEIIMSKLREDKPKTMKIFPRFIQNQSSFSVILLPENRDRIILTSHSKDYHKWELKEFPKISKNNFIFINTDETFADVWKTFVKQLRNKKNFIAINPSKQFLIEDKSDIVEILNLANIVILNKDETELFLKEKDEPQNLIKKFRNVLQSPKILVITMDKNGVIVINNNEIFRSKGFAVEKIADGTGAGDAFGSAFCGYLIKSKLNLIEKNIKEAIRRGCANAVSVIEDTGAQKGILSEDEYSKKRFSNIKIDKI